MADFDTVHETLVFERDFICTRAALFEAFADPVARARWGQPSDTAVIILDSADFRVGGSDRSRCGTKENPEFQVDATYLDIQPGTRIVYSERVAKGDMPLSAALYTIEFGARGEKALLQVTVQIAAFVGADMVAGVKQGFDAALENLSREFER